MLPSSRNSTTAILFFANSAQLDQSRKKIAKSELLFDTLNREMLHKLTKTGIPFFHIDEQQQVGDSFGTRFISALGWVYEQGFENVIAVGNDTPQLTTKHLLEAQKQLEKGKTVIGPSLDGGFYLLGLPKDQFSPDLFEILPWQHFSLFQRITTLLAQTGSLHKLPKFSDIDSTNAIHILLREHRTISAFLYRILKRFANKTLVAKQWLKTVIASGFLPTNYNKGSPVLLPRL